MLSLSMFRLKQKMAMQATDHPPLKSARSWKSSAQLKSLLASLLWEIMYLPKIWLFCPTFFLIVNLPIVCNAIFIAPALAF